MKCLTLSLLLFFLGFGAVANGSEYASFTRDLVEPYDYYKKSLSLTSRKEDAEKAKGAVASFMLSWEKLASKYAVDVPKPFVGVRDFPAKIARPVEVAKLAAAQLKDGEVAKAHATLEEVRYLLWHMRVGAGIVSLSDKANDFHEVMEIVLARAAEARTAEEIRKVHDRYAAWMLIKWDDMTNADDVRSVKEQLEPALAEGRKQVVTYLDALKAGDSAAGKLGSGVKGAYKRVWMLKNQ